MATLTKKPAIVFGAILLMSALLIAMPGTADEEIQGSYRINALEWAETADDYVLMIQGDSQPTYTMYELFNPLRLVIDIADASVNPSVDISTEAPRGPVSRINSQLLEDKEPFITRIELFLEEDNSYTVDRSDNDIIVQFAKESGGAEASSPPAPSEGRGDLGESPDAPAAMAEMEEIEETALDDSASARVSSPAREGMDREKASVLFDIEVEHSAEETRVFLKSDGPITDYKAVELAKNIKAGRPDRMYIDVKDVKPAGPIQPKVVGTALDQVRTGPRSDGFRVVFDSSLDELFSYRISEQPDGLLITISEPSPAATVIADLMGEDDSIASPATAPEPEIMENSGDDQSDDAPTQTIKISEPGETDPATPEMRKPASRESAGESLAFAGYNKQRITVDFYKIDLHNVFRLFGEISNLNIVVDEAVGGSLTLALNDVPWDFALDIILNLKDLQKEERYNTIVISPKSKEFKWPERTLESVEFKADQTLDIQQQDTDNIQISKRQEVSETVVEAKNLIHQAQNLERLSNYTGALELYEEAYDKWPENTIIAKRIAALCLVRLGQNAKAVHYAKMALKADPTDYDSALQAAIGLARMKKNEEAMAYFEKAVSGSQPSTAALSSYAAFNEEHQQFDKALALLERHEELYGDSLETMISKARIHDKQGHRELAAAQYRTILLSGYEVPADLARYIKGRASLGDQ
ncbi:MAG: AMIN domain-containing protein [Desulfobulbaceae bacterium]|nr:AMIN domain-containing protein [Desulfobulbaceae bacterium]